LLSPKSRMLYADNVLFLNGESYQMGMQDRALLKRFADLRALEPADIAGASTDVREALHQWYGDGWLLLDEG
ncbi:MAG: winged helix domain-containing protein, partial [Burkholderiaceae bacterium]